MAKAIELHDGLCKRSEKPDWVHYVRFCLGKQDWIDAKINPDGSLSLMASSRLAIEPRVTNCVNVRIID